MVILINPFKANPKILGQLKFRKRFDSFFAENMLRKVIIIKELLRYLKIEPFSQEFSTKKEPLKILSSPIWIYWNFHILIFMENAKIFHLSYFFRPSNDK